MNISLSIPFPLRPLMITNPTERGTLRSIKISLNFFDQGQRVALHSHNFFPKIGVPLPGEIIQIISN